jgi:hypothetical protein
MRIRPINYWQRRLLFGLPTQPNSIEEQQNLDIAELFAKVKNTDNHTGNNKTKAA